VLVLVEVAVGVAVLVDVLEGVEVDVGLGDKVAVRVQVGEAIVVGVDVCSTGPGYGGVMVTCCGISGSSVFASTGKNTLRGIGYTNTAVPTLLAYSSAQSFLMLIE